MRDKSNACNVDVAVSHGNHSEIFLSHFLSACREFSRLTELGCLGSLTACVGVNFGVENEDVYILAACKDVVKVDFGKTIWELRSARLESFFLDFGFF